MSRRACAWPGCHRTVDAEMFSCQPHWRMLPGWARQRIAAAYQSGQGRDPTLISMEYIVAYEEAMTWIRERFPGTQLVGNKPP